MDEDESLENIDSDEENDFDQNLDIITTFKQQINTPHKEHFKEFVFLMKENDLKQIRLITLPHPKNAKSARFLITSENELQEIQRAKRTPSSYFINQRVQEDGSLYITTPIDPLYILLPRLEELRNTLGKHIDRNQIFTSGEYPSFKYLDGCKNSDFSIICDIKNKKEQNYYRLNDEKTLQWLKRKVDQIGEYIATVPGTVRLVRSQAASYRNKTDEKLSNDQVLNLAVGFLSEYLPKKWHTLLSQSYGLKTTEICSFSFTETELVVDAKYGTIRDKRKAPDTPSSTPSSQKKRRVRPHEKIDTSKNKKLTSFFTVVKKEDNK